MQAPYPAIRHRRLRRTDAMRRMVRETRLTADDLIWPIFVTEHDEGEVPSMPGVTRRSVAGCVEAAQEARELGIPTVCLFPHVDPAKKTLACEEAWDPENLSNRATRAVKDAVPDILVMTDVALDPYNASGHDGIVVDGEIVNDASVEALTKMALAQAAAGADILGPSDMMDGRIGAMRAALEASGHQHTVILSYAAKFASAFYGPFRDAVGASGALTGDKKTYQIDPANTDEALRCVARDLAEGADMVMVKPGLAYLDVARRVKERFAVSVAAYQVSGEYAMIRAAAQNGWIDGEAVMMESLLAFRRAGCDSILTYFAPEAARLIRTD